MERHSLFAPDPENIELLSNTFVIKEDTFLIQFEKDKVLNEVLLKNGFMLDYTHISSAWNSYSPPQRSGI